MDRKLAVQAAAKLMAGIVLLALLLFLPAGTLYYWNAWLLLALLFLSMPLVLGSLISFMVFLAYPFIIAKRIRNEELVLAAGLAGYSDYQKRVKYKLIPFLW